MASLRANVTLELATVATADRKEVPAWVITSVPVALSAMIDLPRYSTVTSRPVVPPPAVEPESGLLMVAMAPHALYIIHFRDRLPARLRSLALFSLGLLTVIPVVRFGAGNDFVMRGSIAPLAIVWFAFAHIWLTPGQAKRAAGRSGAIIAALCAAAGVFEISLQTVRAPWGVSACAVDQSNAELTGAAFAAHYMVRLDAMPDWLLREPAAARPAMTESCWDDGGPWTHDPRLTRPQAYLHQARPGAAP